MTATALSSALNLAYTAEQVSLFGIVVGFALLLTGIGLSSSPSKRSHSPSTREERRSRRRQPSLLDREATSRSRDFTVRLHSVLTCPLPDPATVRRTRRVRLGDEGGRQMHAKTRAARARNRARRRIDRGRRGGAGAGCRCQEATREARARRGHHGSSRALGLRWKLLVQRSRCRRPDRVLRGPGCVARPQLRRQQDDESCSTSTRRPAARTCRRPAGDGGILDADALRRRQCCRPDGATIYYWRRTSSAATATPPGFKMIAGDAKATSPQVRLITFWDCGARGRRTSDRSAGVSGQRGSMLRLHVTFPSRWNGVHSTAEPQAARGVPDGTVAVPRATTSPSCRSRSIYRYPVTGRICSSWPRRGLLGPRGLLQRVEPGRVGASDAGLPQRSAPLRQPPSEVVGEKG